MEKNVIIFNIIKKIVKYANFVTISSEGFKEFLPDSNYITVHSYNDQVLSKCKVRRNIQLKKEPIHICFIGYVRFYEVDKKIIDILGNDSRYIIQYFGSGSDKLKEYAQMKNIKNVEFSEGFKVEETHKFLDKADVINNLYGVNDIALDTAISIKYYYALYLNIPILVFKGTYMDRISKEAGIGFSVDKLSEEFADEFYNWYCSIDHTKISNTCKKQIREFNLKNEEFYEVLKNNFKADEVK